MKPLHLLFTTLVLIAGCKTENKITTEESNSKSSLQVVFDYEALVDVESKLLFDYLVEMGDYTNSRSFPSMIKIQSVHEGLTESQQIIDIRSSSEYQKGHINGSMNVAFSDLLDYFENDIVPFNYERIVLVSSSGQVSGYAACLLRLMGYGNVYSMRWGMSGWNKAFAADYWQQNVSSKFEANLETKVYPKGEPGFMPQLKTGKTTGAEVLESRIRRLFSAGYEKVFVSSDSVFANPDRFYVMNYDRKDKYESGHIPGAIRYKPQATLGILEEMTTIPSDKEALVYCGTGHTSGFVTAYLRLFGYDAKALKYGNAGFMHNKMIAEKSTLSWRPFLESEIAGYEYER